MCAELDLGAGQDPVPVGPLLFLSSESATRRDV